MNKRFLMAVAGIGLLIGGAYDVIDGQPFHFLREATVRKTVATTAPENALTLLQDGNRRFVEGEPVAVDLRAQKRQALVQGQTPFAVVVSCSDSRVPPELIFNQGLGDLFVIRVAGNVVDDHEIGSVEYAVEHLKAPLVVVLGHEKCGAVAATVQGGEVHGHIDEIVKKIKPSVEKAKASSVSGNDLVEEAVVENVRNTVNALEKSAIIKAAIQKQAILLVGAKYDLDEGQVQWLNQPVTATTQPN
ncbi:carbonic anhydrase [Heliophilum fasciatum]|uniref:Carbonic anhydrase n=1 Tax=Heliophilum fasciatum TaxID=35700 RepID=A0A4R2RRT1_9FIRM|nr:carbonic anhydrase [Heliophilum fasciatum]MCW2277512.1 carbonic anhydrase [Heliophilum fasciatum]TCP65197.1 carbonic anhydrase [Heliophilum fasciatum]